MRVFAVATALSVLLAAAPTFAQAPAQTAPRPAAPATQDFWVAKSQGTGTQKLDWDVKDGDWSVVVMNADGSPGVHADISAGADVAFVGAVATALIISGLAGLGIGAALLAFGFISTGGRRTPSSPLLA